MYQRQNVSTYIEYPHHDALKWGSASGLVWTNQGALHCLLNNVFGIIKAYMEKKFKCFSWFKQLDNLLDKWANQMACEKST